MKILIADDHAYNRELLLFILEDQGHQCFEAENGRVACDLVADNRDIQLVLMDVSMPVLDGIEATRTIRAMANDRLVTIIFVTALDDPSILVKCLDAGGDDFVPKPVNESILLSKLNAHARNQAVYASLKAANAELEYHQKLIDREHRLVEHIFANEVGASETQCENITAYTSPASLFNGDLLISASSPAGGVYLLVGDFTGHGLSAAVGSLPVSGIFYEGAAKQESVATIARAMNRRLHRLLPPGMFFCAALMYLEPCGRQVQIWMGGMNDIVCRPASTANIHKLSSRYMPLGILEDNEFVGQVEVLEVEEGTCLYIFTDGINEAQNACGEEFGLARVDQTIAVGGNVVETLVTQVHEFTAGCKQADDVSLVELLCCPVVHRMSGAGTLVDVGADFRQAKSFPWQLTMRLSAADLRSSDVVMQVGKFLGTIQGVELHQDKIFTIISELYSNALEHGVLRLQSELKATPDGFDEYYRLREQRLASLEREFIAIELEYLRGDSRAQVPNKLKIVVHDSGDGFDSGRVKSSQGDSDAPYGRGLELLQCFCESLTYRDSGRTATAVYAFA